MFGIGSTAPGAKLDISYDSGVGFYLNAGSGANTIMRFKQNNTETATLFTLNGKNDLHLRAAGQVWLDGGSGNSGALVVDSSGIVGIGTTNPSNKLQIVGTRSNTISVSRQAAMVELMFILILEHLPVHPIGDMDPINEYFKRCTTSIIKS
jgi:hypothetical protein